MPSTAKSDELSSTGGRIGGTDQTVVSLSASTSVRLTRLLCCVHGIFPTPQVPIRRLAVDLPGQVSIILTASRWERHPPDDASRPCYKDVTFLQ